MAQPQLGLGLHGLPCVQLKRNTSSFVLYYWCIVPALSTNELCWPLSLLPTLPAPIVRGSDGVTGAGPLSQSQSPSQSPSPPTAREVTEEQLDLSPAGQHEGLDSGQLSWLTPCLLCSGVALAGSLCFLSTESKVVF